jgi:hypothetical protein
MSVLSIPFHAVEEYDRQDHSYNDEERRATATKVNGKCGADEQNPYSTAH